MTMFFTPSPFDLLSIPYYFCLLQQYDDLIVRSRSYDQIFNQSVKVIQVTNSLSSFI